uniref:Tua6 n=1 Tax=Arundo donax TaxID=35708 RepID=A0A0A9D375_ARUDO
MVSVQSICTVTMTDMIFSGENVKWLKTDVYRTCVMSTSEVVCGIFLVGDELLGMEELAVWPVLHLVNDSRLQVDKQGPWNVLPRTGFTEECVECIPRNPKRGITASQRAKTENLDTVNRSAMHVNRWQITWHPP